MDDPLPSGNSLVSAPSGVGSSDDVDEVELKEQPSAARQAQTSFLKTTSCESSAASMSRVVRVQQSVELGQQPSTNWSPTTSVVALLDAETAPKFDFLLERERGKKEAPVVMNKRIITKVEDAATQVTPKIAAGGGFKFMARNNADQVGSVRFVCFFSPEDPLGLVILFFSGRRRKSARLDDFIIFDFELRQISASIGRGKHQRNIRVARSDAPRGQNA